jgi:pseudoazurin
MRGFLKLTAFAIVAATLAAPLGAHAADVEVKMVNKGANGLMAFEPSFVKIAPGDVVHFVLVDKGHNVESLNGMIPDGATAFAGKINQPLDVTFDKAGVYGIRCKPHYGMGMVGLIVVGEPTNADAAKVVPQTGMAKKVFAKLFEQLAGS